VLPGGDLAIAWTDYREGRPQIYFRSRTAGAWGPELPVAALPGDCHNPALAAHHSGVLSLAFQHIVAGAPQILLMRFSPTSAFGQPIPITAASESPGGPAVVTMPSGGTWVMWADHATEPTRWWFARFHPDSGVSSREALMQGALDPQVAMSAVADPGGILHLVWQVSGPGYTQLYYQSRPGGERTLIESHGGLIQNPVMEVDRDRALHLVYERAQGSAMQVRYRCGGLGRGWDARSTDLCYPDTRGTSRPLPLPTEAGNVSVIYNRYDDDAVRLVVRRRQLRDVGGLSPAPEPVVALPRLRFGPTPLRAGAVLEIALDPAAAPSERPRFELYDVGGRRVASLELRRENGRWTGQVPGAITREWPSGVYFGRVPELDGRSMRVVVLR
jgi:hypothetical protein